MTTCEPVGLACLAVEGDGPNSSAGEHNIKIVILAQVIGRKHIGPSTTEPLY